jgi:hypothetical protein
MLLVVAAGCAVTYRLLLRTLRQTATASRRELEQRLSALTEVIARLEARLAEPSFSTEALDAREMESQPIPVAPMRREEQTVAPEIQVAIAAAAVALLGRGARVRSLRTMSPQDAVSPWSQQGRLIVQASHNLRSRG